MIPFTSIKSTLFAVGLVLLIGNSYTHLSAQSNITKASTPIAHFTNYNTEQGLALSSISSSIVDQKGYIWFGTFGGGVRDGMDIALCSLKLSENSAPSGNYELQFSGANRPLIIVRNGELIKIKPDKQPIGKSTNNQPFTSHTITVLKGDMVYLFSDGYADQFGGEKGKKFMTKQLYDLLIQIANKPLSVQQNTLKQTLKTWQGNYHQVDDICIMGVRI